MNKWQLEKLARVLVRTGVNIQPGETMVLQTDTLAIDLAREITKEAFAAGAADVEAFISDAEIDHLKALNCSVETLRNLPEWKKEAIDSILRTGKGVQMGVRASRPFINADVPDEKLKAQAYASNELRNVVRHYIHQGCQKWTGTVYPSLEWAKRVFPEYSDEEAYAKLEEAICKMMRIDEDSDPVENWKQHCAELSVRSRKLNDFNFKTGVIDFLFQRNEFLFRPVHAGRLVQQAHQTGHSGNLPDIFQRYRINCAAVPAKRHFHQVNTPFQQNTGASERTRPFVSGKITEHPSAAAARG